MYSVKTSLKYFLIEHYYQGIEKHYIKPKMNTDGKTFRLLKQVLREQRFYPFFIYITRKKSGGGGD